MLSNISQKKQHVKRIIVNEVEIPKRISKELKSKRFNNDNIKSYGDHSVQSNKEIARQLSNEYLQDCTVHGVKYLGHLQFKTNIFGRLFWAVIMICSFIFLAWMLEKFWVRYTTNPVRSVIGSFQAPSYMIPFPAVTFCPLIPALAATRKKLLHQLRLPHNMDNKTARFLLRYGPAFTHVRTRNVKTHINDLKALLKINHMSLMDFIKLLRPCEDLFDYCSWDNIPQNCSDIFKISYTFGGICCSFNYLLEESIESGRTWDDTEFLRTTSFGGRSGLLAVLHRDLLVEGDEDGKYSKYTTNSAGLLMYIHHPLEYVGPISPHHIIQAGQELRVAIITKIYHYLANSYGGKVPQCVKKDNNDLKYFPAYRYSNCFISCSIESIFQACNCVPYYYTPMAKNYSLRICGWEDFRCLQVNSEKTRIMQNIFTENITCKCRYPCKNVFYQTQATLIDLNGEHESNVSPFYKNNTDAQAVVRVFLNSETYVEMDTIPIADELYLLASIGGIFSLFVGCSFISAVEIFYFIGLFIYSCSNSNKKSK